jgi:hypothetical protein
MNLRFIRPEDRRRSGGSGAGPGVGIDWADTEPVCFRSEAFAEDLQAVDAGPAAARLRAWAPVQLLRRPPAWLPAVGLALFAALGLGLGAGD